MTSPLSDSVFTDDVARLYDSMLVPLIFESYANNLAALTQSLAPRHVLEVACGTGVVTRALASRLSADTEIVATDLNDAMVAYGQRAGTARDGIARDVMWRQADVMTLPFAAHSFDVVVCQFGVMFFPDRVAAYQEIRRVLRPGGTFLFNVWRAIEHNEFAAIVVEAMNCRYADNPSGFLARTPHGYGSSSEIERDVRAAGFATCHLEMRDDVSAASSPSVAAVAYCQGTPLRNEIELREPGGLERATAAAAEALRTCYGDGPITGAISAYVVQAS